MRRRHAVIVLASASSLLSVLLAVAVNVATGGTLPGPVGWLKGLAWPLVVVLALVTVGFAVWQQRVAEDPADPVTGGGGPLHWVAPAELPVPIGDFAGRTADLRELRRIVAAGKRVVAVVGAAGMGKSTLAIRLGHEIRDRYPDGQLYVNLGAGRGDRADPAAVLSRFLAALGAGEDEQRGDEDDLAVRFRSRTAGRRLLILLDDAADARQVRHLLPGGERCLALITSRSVLADLPEAAVTALGELTEQEAVTLVSGIVGSDRAGAEPEATLALVRACGRLPLAVRIAAARLRGRPGWAVSELVARLDDERHRLDELRVGDLAVRASFEAGYAALPEPDRALFRGLGAYAGAWITAEAAAAAAGWQVQPARLGLERLADAQLVEPGAAGSYQLHDLIRLFAVERLAREGGSNARQQALRRLLRWYEDAAGPVAAGWDSSAQADLAAVIRTATEAGLDAEAFRTAKALDPALWNQPSQLPRLVIWTEVLDAVHRLGDDRATADSLLRLGQVYDHEGQVEHGVDLLRQSVGLWERVGDPAAATDARRELGNLLRHAGHYAEAAQHLEGALAAYRALGHRPGEARTLRNLGVLHLVRREPQRVIDYVEPLLATMAGEPDPDEPLALPYTQLILGNAYSQAGRFAEAGRLLEACRTAYEQLGYRTDVARSLRALGNLAYAQHRYAQALAHHRAALAIFEEASYATGIAEACQAVGSSLFAQGDLPAAADAFRRAVATYRGLGDRTRLGIALLHLTRALLAAHQLTEADACRAEADALLAGTDLPDAAEARAHLPAPRA
ncbi:ATP-binding protein [Streptomyces sviceus]|uniref:ATP-binding protein n=1 Tax=Streptomyces sviceus TaxID=285530 RepID=UPI0036A6CE57